MAHNAIHASAHKTAQPASGLMRKVMILVLAATFALAGVPFQPLASATQAAWANEAAATGIADNGESDGIVIELDESALPSAGIDADGISPFSLQSAESTQQDEASADEIQELLAESGNGSIEVEGVVARFDGSVLVEAQPSDGMTDEQAAQEAASVPGVKSAQPNYVYSLIGDGSQDGQDGADALGDGLNALASAGLPNDPFLQRSSSSQSNNQYWAYASKLTQAWENAGSSRNVTVALFDTAVDMDHPDLEGNLLADLAYNATDRDLVSNAPISAGRHGTMTAGLVSAVANNNLGIAGASYNAKVLPVAVFDEKGSSDTTRLLSAFSYVFRTMEQRPDTNIKVVNISAGRYASSNTGNDNMLQAYIDTALARYGILTVCAGGNGYNNEFRVPRTDRLIPSDFPNAVSVTSLNPDNTNVVGSDYNMAKDISAAGMNVYSTSLGNGFSSGSGTSLSAPIVSGTIAMLYAAAPESSASQILDALYGSADEIVDARNDRSKVSGSHGSLDAYMALICSVAYEGRPFTDVRSGQWYYESVAYNKYYSLMNGISGARQFQPDRGITRAEAAAVLYNYADPQYDSEPAAKSDVDQSEWYAKCVNWACANGVMNGYAHSDRFGPNDPLTREQLTCIIANYARNYSEPVDMSKFNSFADRNAVSPWAKDDVAWAISKGVINGVGSGSNRTISPQGIVSRAEMAAIMMNSITTGVLD